MAWDPRLKTAQQRASARCSSSRRRSAHRDKLGAAVLAAAAAAAASPLASVTAALHLAAASLRWRGRLATLAGAPRCCPPLAAAPLEPAASPVDPAVRTTAATASRLAAAATALPLAAERCLASLSPRPGRGCAQPVHTLSFSVL